MTLHVINKSIREAFKELVDCRKDVEAAKALRDGQLIRMLKRRELRMGRLLARNSKTFATLDLTG